MEVRTHEDTVDSGKSKALSTLSGFILPDSRGHLFLLQYFVMFATNYCYICIAYFRFIGSGWSRIV